MRRCAACSTYSSNGSSAIPKMRPTRRRREPGPPDNPAEIGYLADEGEGKCRTACRSMSRTGSRSRSEEHTSELQSLMRISYAVFCLQKKTKKKAKTNRIK